MKITKSQLAQIIKEELSNTMMEGFGLVGALSAVKDAEDKGIADAQEDFARIQAGGKVLQIDTTEETQEEEDAYNKGWQNEMDRLKQSGANRKLNRPPPPETPEDIEAAQAEYDFESHFSESRKITKSKLAQIVQEELAAIKAEGYDAGQAVWMEKFKLHARVPQNQELSDEMKNNAQDAFRQGMDPAQAAKELSAITAEGYKSYKRDDKNKNPKGLSPQYRFTDAASTDDTEERFHKSEHSPYSDKKPRRGKKGLGEDGSGYSWGARSAPEPELSAEELGQDEDIQEMIRNQIEDNLEDGPLTVGGILALTEPEHESPYEHLADQWEDILDAALHEMSEEPNATIEKSHDTMTGEPYYSPIGFLS